MAVFSPEQGDQRARTGAPMTVMLHDKGLSTDIDWQNKDYSGKTISSRYRSQFYRTESGRRDPGLECHREKPRDGTC